MSAGGRLVEVRDPWAFAEARRLITGQPPAPPPPGRVVETGLRFLNLLERYQPPRSTRAAHGVSSSGRPT